MNRRNKIKNPRRPPQWSEATLKKKNDWMEANKHKIEEKMRKKDLHKRYMRLKTRKSKRAFNRLHGRYGAGKTKKPRWGEDEIGGWEKEKQDTYRAGRTQRELLKGMSRAERLAYFKELRKDWDDDKLAAWKESWKIKKETWPWNKKRQPRRKNDDGEEEEKEHEPVRQK